MPQYASLPTLNNTRNTSATIVVKGPIAIPNFTAIADATVLTTIVCVVPLEPFSFFRKAAYFLLSVHKQQGSRPYRSCRSSAFTLRDSTSSLAFGEEVFVEAFEFDCLTNTKSRRA
jgi:hypothetical protein